MHPGKAETMKYKVVRNTSGFRQAWCGRDGFTKYSTPVLFDDVEQAKVFVKSKSYPGMSFELEIAEAGDK